MNRALLLPLAVVLLTAVLGAAALGLAVELARRTVVGTTRGTLRMFVWRAAV